MADLLDEVLRDHSDEKKLTYFRKLLVYVTAFTIVVIVGMLVNNWYQNKKQLQLIKLGDLFTKVIATEGNNEEALNAKLPSLKTLINQSDSRVAELASIEQVSIQLNNSDEARAKSLLTDIVNNNAYSEVTRAYARLLWLNLNVDLHAPLEEDDKKTLEEYLSYFSDENKPFFASGSLVKAMWQLKNQQPSLAKDTLQKVISLTNTNSTSIKDQAISLLATIK